MIIISSPLKSDVFKALAEDAGLKFVGKTGIKMKFESSGENDMILAAELKQKFKCNQELAAVVFHVTVE